MTTKYTVAPRKMVFRMFGIPGNVAVVLLALARMIKKARRSMMRRRGESQYVGNIRAPVVKVHWKLEVEGAYRSQSRECRMRGRQPACSRQSKI